MKLVDLDNPVICSYAILDHERTDISEDIAVLTKLDLIPVQFIMQYRERLDRNKDYAGAAALYNLILYWEQEVSHGQ